MGGGTSAVRMRWQVSKFQGAKQGRRWPRFGVTALSSCTHRPHFRRKFGDDVYNLRCGTVIGSLGHGARYDSAEADFV